MSSLKWFLCHCNFLMMVSGEEETHLTRSSITTTARVNSSTEKPTSAGAVIPLPFSTVASPRSRLSISCCVTLMLSATFAMGLFWALLPVVAVVMRGGCRVAGNVKWKVGKREGEVGRGITCLLGRVVLDALATHHA